MTNQIINCLNKNFFGHSIQNIFRMIRQSDERSAQNIARDPFEVKSILLTNSEAEYIIFDVGAHKGFIIQRYRTLFPKARIYAFEPFRKSFDALCDKFKDDHFVSVYNVAISSQLAQANLNVNASTPTNSLLATDINGLLNWESGLLETQEQQLVNVLTLDQFCKDENINHINLLKLDIQGAELLALKGAETLLQRQGIDLIYCEVILVPSYVDQVCLHELLAFTYDFNYQLFGIYNLYHNQLRLNQIDIILVSERFLQNYIEK